MRLCRLDRLAHIPAPHQIGLDIHVLRQTYPMHWHEFFELVFVISGTGVSRINGVTTALAEGDSLLLTPSDFHEIGPELGGELRIFNLDFTLGAVGPEIAAIVLSGACGARARRAEGEELCEMLRRLESLAGELGQQRVAREQALRLDLDRILLAWHRLRVATLAQPAPSGHAAPLPAPVQRALAYLHEHFADPLSLEQIAGHAGLSPNYFSELFRKSTGTAFQHYLQRVRLDFAHALLSSSTMPVTEAAFAAGFNTLAHFERSFRACFGATPSMLRKAAPP